MPYYDLELDALRTYRTSSRPPADLDGYWARALADARGRAVPATLTPHRPDVYGALAVDDVVFSGADGDPIRAWLLRPRAATGRLACRVVYIGYGGGRGLPVDHALWAAAGHAVLVMDSRGQGGSWLRGDTGDPGGGAGSGPEHPGVMTRGLLDPERYYFRRLFVDAVRALDTARELACVDPDRIAVGGFSQGGAISLAAAALAPDVVRLCHADMPFLCDIAHALALAPDAPYTELPTFLNLHPEHVEQALHTLSHVDCALLAPRIRCRTRVSVGLMDTICPPSSVFAAYNAIEAEKAIEVFPYSGHDLPPTLVEEQLAEFTDMLG